MWGKIFPKTCWSEPFSPKKVASYNPVLSVLPLLPERLQPGVMSPFLVSQFPVLQAQKIGDWLTVQNGFVTSMTYVYFSLLMQQHSYSMFLCAITHMQDQCLQVTGNFSTWNSYKIFCSTKQVLSWVQIQNLLYVWLALYQLNYSCRYYSLCLCPSELHRVD